MIWKKNYWWKFDKLFFWKNWNTQDLEKLEKFKFSSLWITYKMQVVKFVQNFKNLGFQVIEKTW